MKNCNPRVNHTCGDTTWAVCTKYESEVNPQSELIQNECFNIEETTQDQYNQLEDIWGQIELSELGELCLTYVLDENDKIIVKNVLKKLEQEICDLKEKVTTLETTAICDTPISACFPSGFDCLELPCSGTITTLGDWMIAVQTKICTP